MNIIKNKKLDKLSKLYFMLWTLFFVHCGIELTTRYDRIEEDRVRTIAFVYDNHGFAEAAPGDTVHCTAYFAGEKVDSVELRMAISSIANLYGSNFYIDTPSLENYIVAGSKRIFSSQEIDLLNFDFVIPADIIKRRFPEDMTLGDLLSSYMADTIFSPEFKNLRPYEVIDIIENVAKGVGYDSIPLFSPQQLTNDTLFSLLNGFLQALTIEIKILAKINNKYKTESILTVRYNTLLARVISSIPTNRNPEYKWIKCVRVKGLNGSFFDPLNDYELIDTVYELFPGSEVIEIDLGYQYFLVADSAIFPVDYGYSLTDVSGNKREETFLYEWFYQNTNDIDKKGQDSLMVLGNNLNGNVVELLPSLDSRQTEFSLWVVLRDRFIGERLRPVGFNVKYVKGLFSYSQAYKDYYR